MSDNNKFLTKRSIKAGAWLGGYRFYARFINLLKTPVLTRIFLPADLGIFGFVSIALNLFETFTETGLEQALIQKKHLKTITVSTAWYINLVRSLLISLILFLVAPLFSWYFEAPTITAMIQVIAITPILRSLRNPSMIYAKKNLAFGKETIMLVAGSTTEVIVTLIIALQLQTIWALVIAILAGGLAEIIVSYVVFDPPKLRGFSKQEAQSLLGFGKWVWSSSALSFVANQGDDIIVGKLLGAAPLGLYQYAYKIASLPATQIAGTVSQVTYPAFASIQEDKTRLKRAFLKSLLFVSLTTVPPLILVMLFPVTLVRIIFGENWLGAAPALRVLSLYGIIRSYSNTLGPLAIALGKPQFITYNGIIRVILLFICLLPMTFMYGILGASWATVIAIVLANLVLIVNLKRSFSE